MFCLSQTKEIRVKELGNLSPLNVTIKYVPKLKDFMLQDISKKTSSTPPSETQKLEPPRSAQWTVPHLSHDKFRLERD